MRKIQEKSEKNEKLPIQTQLDVTEDYLCVAYCAIIYNMQYEIYY